MSEAARPETIARRVEQGLLPLPGHGIDVGAGPPGMPGRDWWARFPDMFCRPWDRDDGDATDLASVRSRTLDWLFSSHCLEHLAKPEEALYNWTQCVKIGGKMLISVPHRDLYEDKLSLPSHWNTEHKRFYVPEEADLAGSTDTVPFGPWLRASGYICGFRVLRVEVGDRGSIPASVAEGRHAHGEYCIDALLEVVPGRWWRGARCAWCPKAEVDDCRQACYGEGRAYSHW